MDNQGNVLLQGTRIEPRELPLAVAGFVTSLVTLAALIIAGLALALGFPWVSLGLTAIYLLFPLAIVMGHLALRRIREKPAVYKGEGMAKFALTVGYFNLALAVLALYRMF